MTIPAINERFFSLLSSLLIDYDRKECARESKCGHPNLHRLSLLLQASDDMRKEIDAALPEDEREVLDVFLNSLSHHFLEGFPPRKKLEKILKKYRDTGKIPSMKEV
jgi:hypothetical protein